MLDSGAPISAIAARINTAGMVTWRAPGRAHQALLHITRGSARHGRQRARAARLRASAGMVPRANGKGFVIMDDIRIERASELESFASMALEPIGAHDEAARVRRLAALYRYYASDEWRDYQIKIRPDRRGAITLAHM